MRVFSKLNILKKLFYKLILVSIFIKINKIIGYKPKFKTLLCTIAKNENKYILEFIQHYKKLKFDKIIIYDNNEIKGENFSDILKNDIENNFVKIVNIRGLKTPQKKALEHCYKYNNYDYEWIAFYDIDEYLYLLNYSYINDFLSSANFNKCQSIIINWVYYGDNDKIFYEAKPLEERFVNSVNLTEEIRENKYMYSAAKTIVRGGLYLNWGRFPHYLKNTVNCRPNGNILKDYLSPPEYSDAYLKHYTTKTTEEYIEKLNKGDVLEEFNTDYIKYRIYGYYFLFNKITKQKIDLINKNLKYKVNISF